MSVRLCLVLSVIFCLFSSLAVAETDCQKAKAVAFGFKEWKKGECTQEDINELKAELTKCDAGDEAKLELASHAMHYFSEKMSEKEINDIIKQIDETTMRSFPAEKCIKAASLIMLSKARDIFMTLRTVATNNDRSSCRETLEIANSNMQLIAKDKIKYCGLLIAAGGITEGKTEEGLDENLKNEGLAKAKKDFCQFFPFACKFL